MQQNDKDEINNLLGIGKKSANNQATEEQRKISCMNFLDDLRDAADQAKV